MNIVIPSTEDKARIALNESLQDIVEGGGYGRVLGLGRAISLVQDDEPIIGQEATEFSREAVLHPERYQPLVRMVRTLIERSGLKSPRIIDMGCGPAILSSMIAKEIPTAQVTGVDLSEDMLAIASATAQTYRVADRLNLYQHDMRLVATGASALADLVVSRNMLHRVEGLTDALYKLVSAAKPNGGMVCVAAFRQVSDLDPKGQAAFVAAVRERKGEENLVRAFVRAHLTAPSLEQYRQAALAVAAQLDVAEMRVWAGKSNNVGVYFRR